MDEGVDDTMPVSADFACGYVSGRRTLGPDPGVLSSRPSRKRRRVKLEVSPLNGPKHRWRSAVQKACYQMSSGWSESVSEKSLPGVQAREEKRRRSGHRWNDGR
jgi:hypothetical protein